MMDTLLALQNSDIKVNVFISDENGGKAKLNRKPLSVEDGISRLRKQIYISKDEMNKAQKFLYSGISQYTFVGQNMMVGDIFLISK